MKILKDMLPEGAPSYNKVKKLIEEWKDAYSREPMSEYDKGAFNIGCQLLGQKEEMKK